MRTWTRADLPALGSVLDDALPSEGLTADEIQSACFENTDPTVVLGLPDGEGAVAVVAQPTDEGPVASLLLLAVKPTAQGEGRGRRLLAAAEEWAVDAAGAVSLCAGGSVPFALWPGVDAHWTQARCLFESAGYLDDGAAVLLSFPSAYRVPPPKGVEVGRVISDADAEAALRLCAAHWPSWLPEVTRAVEHATCFLAIAGAAWVDRHSHMSTAAVDRSVGLVCHSVNRSGWIGPIGVVDAHRRQGIGSALLAAVSSDLSTAGLREVHVWPGRPVRFFARTAGASASRVFLYLRRPGCSAPGGRR